MSEHRIERVAIRHPDGRLWTVPAPGRHHHAIREAARYGWPLDEIAESEQGFTDNQGRFLNRCQALHVAKASGQLRRKTTPGAYTGPELYLEDLW